MDDVRTQIDLRTSGVALDGITDGVEFDSNQNTFTQLIKSMYWKRFGICETFLEHYYSFRKNYKVISTVALGYAGTQKTSGEPCTLGNNGIVSKIISFGIIDGQGPHVVVYKGDDFYIRQLNLTMNKDMYDSIVSACDIRLKVSIEHGAEFCGLIYADGHLFPSIHRKLNRIVAHRFRSYQHFCEYQCSLRDWIQQMSNHSELQADVCCNAYMYRTTFDEMQACLDCIKSFSHIDEEQWRISFRKIHNFYVSKRGRKSMLIDRENIMLWRTKF